jgi:sugar phosphate isomerase/epimerase
MKKTNEGELGGRERRQFLGNSIFAGVLGIAGPTLSALGFAEPFRFTQERTEPKPSQGFGFGLVTYLWGKDMDLPTVIDTCEKAGLGAVELRTEHKHAVEPTLNQKQRQEVRERFENSRVQLIGYGSNCEFHAKEPEVVAKNIKQCKDYIHLMHDCGGTGVKVKPNAFVSGVPHEKTIEQIGKSLNELAAYGADFGQQIRLEVHGKETSKLSVVRDIMAVADHKNAVVCWNSNNVDLETPGLQENFQMVETRLGATTHVRKLDDGDYPYDLLFELLLRAKYTGWVLLEAHSDPADKLAALREQKVVFERLLKNATDKMNASK